MSRRREFQAGAVFSHVYPALPPLLGTGMRQERVRLSSLGASQKHLDPVRVQHYVDNPDHDPITVVQTRVGKVIYDGHNRAAAAKRRGEKTMQADVVDWK